MAEGGDEIITDGGERVVARLIEEEIKNSFLDYSMSVIVQRALPDVRDGLKPVHRRILYAMNELGLIPTRPYKKSATVVGDVLGKYHPHGDIAVYDSLVRMVQTFSLRYPLIDGQGNFGSIDGDSAAAYRYTEARLTPLALELLDDIEKETVPFIPNFDGQQEEPTVLPSKAPNLLINGSSGIAVGMATNIPPHNLREIVDACVALIADRALPDEQLEEIVRGPDFPTGGYICGREGIREAFRTGRGRIVMRAKTHVEEDPKTGQDRIVVTEIPFMVNKSRMIEQIAILVRDKVLTDIRDMRDESDRDGMRIVIELKRDAVPVVTLNRLFKHTQMQSTFGAIFLALVDGGPKVMPLREMLLHFIDHRQVVVIKRSQFDLRKALADEHILEGLKIAVDNIDEVIAIIRASNDSEEARGALQARFAFSDLQARAILAMRLSALTGLEMAKLDEELTQVRATIAELREILASEERRLGIVSKELVEIADKYGDARRTEIVGTNSDFDIEDLIAEEDVVITVSHTGYVKRMPVTTYKAQRRGGRGLLGMETKDEDWVEHLFVASTHDYIMIFTRKGHCHWLKVWQVPSASRISRGKPIVNLVNIPEGDEVAALVPVRVFSDERYLLFATRKGTVKKTALSAYGNVRAVGLNAMSIRDDDELIDVQITSGDDEVILATRQGIAIRFHESDARPMGRVTEGVRGISLEGDDDVIGMVVARKESSLLVVTEKGMGKRTDVGEYRFQRRGGKGVINIKTTERTGRVIAIKNVVDGEQLMVITRAGVVNRQRVDEIRVIGRNTQGVKLVNLDEGDVVVDVARVIADDEEAETPVGAEDASTDGAGESGSIADEMSGLIDGETPADDDDEEEVQ
jgi:DNA gyrase subunit A